MAMPIHGFSGGTIRRHMVGVDRVLLPGQPGALPVAQMQTMPMTFPGGASTRAASRDVLDCLRSAGRRFT